MVSLPPYPAEVRAVFATGILLWAVYPSLSSVVGSVLPASPSLNQWRRKAVGMATESGFNLPTEDDYKEQTREVRAVHLPDGDFQIPLFHAPPGELMTMIEKHGLGGMFAGQGVNPEDAVDDDGGITLNAFMRENVLPNVAVSQINNVDFVHWGDVERGLQTAKDSGLVQSDATLEDAVGWDLSKLTKTDMVTLITGLVDMDDVDDDDAMGDKLNQFP